ncbi:MAG: transcriptional repressor NrdR [Parcubacteria group bacterium]|nr:transcriptional repressor NrdR [Parcubacteria group bacterium]
MKCPSCGFFDTRVVDSRATGDDSAIRRRRECAKCHFRFSTNEEVEILNLMVVKRDGRRESYQREKLITGIRKACEKRPISDETIQHMVRAIEQEIQCERENEIESTRIGEIVMEHLKELDPIAYVRFASVYMAFEDLKNFEELMKGLKSEKMKRHEKTAA